MIHSDKERKHYSREGPMTTEAVTDTCVYKPRDTRDCQEQQELRERHKTNSPEALRESGALLTP